jgi:23S rRNA (uracil1939-C5)-methyltransferase
MGTISGSSAGSQGKNLCQHFGVCGGCESLNTRYLSQLKEKERKLHKLFQSYRKLTIREIVPSPREFNYRCKVQLPFGSRRFGRKSLPILGLHSNDHKFIVDQAECKIQDEGLTKAAQAIRQWARRASLSVYNEKSGSGILRHVVLRKAIGTNEILACVVTNDSNILNNKEISKSLFSHLRDALGKKGNLGKLVGIVQNLNSKKTNMVLSKEYHTLWGRPYMIEKIGRFSFKVGIGNFIQVNPYQTPTLYNLVKEHVPKGSRVVEGYAGMATIGIWISDQAESVIANEENPDSCRSAIEAIRTNNIKNVKIVKGSSQKILPQLLQKENPDVLILDPPRIGVDPYLIDSILESLTPKIIYVSCDPETLQRDVGILSKGYYLKELIPVDLFPHTPHLETVAILERR